MANVTPDRELALETATALHTPGYADLIQQHGIHTANHHLRATATSIWRWLTGPAHLRITIGPTRDHDGHPDPHPDNNGGQPVQLRITDQTGRPYQADLTVQVYDAVGNEITDDPGTMADDLTWTLDSGDGIVTLDVSPDTRTCTVTATALGSAVVRVTLAELTGTVAVDVIPGDAASLQITEGEPRPRPDTEPEPVEPQ